MQTTNIHFCLAWAQLPLRTAKEFHRRRTVNCWPDFRPWKRFPAVASVCAIRASLVTQLVVVELAVINIGLPLVVRVRFLSENLAARLSCKSSRFSLGVFAVVGAVVKAASSFRSIKLPSPAVG